MLKLERKNLLKVLAAFAVGIFMNAPALVGERADTSVIDLFIYRVFGSITSDTDKMFVLTVENIVFIVLFSIMFAGYISSHFRYSCVYVFSRLKSRKRWYAERMAELMIYAVMYVGIYIWTTFAMCVHISLYPYNPVDIWAAVLIAVCSILVTVNITVAINILSMRFGSTVSFFVVQAIVAGLIMLAFKADNTSLLARANPFVCLGLLDSETKIDMIISNIILLTVLFFSGMRYVEKYDVALYDPELN